MSRTPRPPRVDGAPQATWRQTFEALGWTASYHPWKYLGLLAAVYVLCVVVMGIEFLAFGATGAWLWLVLPAAAALCVGMLVGAFSLQWARDDRVTYATRNARLAIVQKRRGWYVADHVMRPGADLEGHRLRLHVRDVLTAAADAQRVTVRADTRSEKLARIYMRCVPGMQIASRRGKNIRLVRYPR